MASSRRTSTRLSGGSTDSDFPPAAILRGKSNGMSKGHSVDDTMTAKKKMAKKQVFKPQPIPQNNSSDTPPDDDLPLPPPPPSERKPARKRPSARREPSPDSPPPAQKRQKMMPPSSKPVSKGLPPGHNDPLRSDLLSSAPGPGTSSIPSDINGSSSNLQRGGGGGGGGAVRKIDFLNFVSSSKPRASMPRPESPPPMFSSSNRTRLPDMSHHLSASTRSNMGNMGPPPIEGFVRKTRKSMGKMGISQDTSMMDQDDFVPLQDKETPMIRKNKELREQQQRRSSLGLRGQRASSSFGRGEITMPHPSVESSQYYKHIAPSIPEPIRARHLLVYCAKKASEDHLDRKRSKSKSKEKEKEVRTEEGDKLVRDIMESFMVGLGKGEVDTNVFSSTGQSGGMSLSAHPQNVINRKEEAKMEAIIKRRKEEESIWSQMKTRANARQGNVIKETRIKQANSKLPPNMTEAPSWMNSALKIADEIISDGVGVLEESGEFGDVEFKVDLLHQSTHTALQYSLQAERFLDGIFSTLTTDLKSRENHHSSSSGNHSSETDPDPSSLLSAAASSSSSSNTNVKGKGKGKAIMNKDPIFMLRALAAADSKNKGSDLMIEAVSKVQGIPNLNISTSGGINGIGSSGGGKGNGGLGISVSQTPRRAAPTPRRTGATGNTGGGLVTGGTGGISGKIYGRGTQTNQTES